MFAMITILVYLVSMQTHLRLIVLDLMMRYFSPALDRLVFARLLKSVASSWSQAILSYRCCFCQQLPVWMSLSYSSSVKIENKLDLMKMPECSRQEAADRLWRRLRGISCIMCMQFINIVYETDKKTDISFISVCTVIATQTLGHVQCNILKFPWSVFITCLTRYLTFTPASPHSEPPGGKKTDWKPDNKLIYFTKNPKEPWPLICNTAQDVLIQLFHWVHLTVDRCTDDVFL